MVGREEIYLSEKVTSIYMPNQNWIELIKKSIDDECDVNANSAARNGIIVFMQNVARTSADAK
jgi:hypothetical protein